MNFVKKKIKPKILAIIDIGSYKIRVGICKFQNNELELVGYGEKRQNAEDTRFQEIQNIEGISQSISNAINKAKEDYRLSYGEDISVEDLVINFPFEEIFFEKSKLTHQRADPQTPINKKELFNIIKNIEISATKKQYQSIKEKSGYEKDDVKLIISGITNILLDKEKKHKIIGESPSQINLGLLNIFIPEAKYELVNLIARSLGKNIYKIIPSEFAISKLFPDKENIVIVDIGNSHTSIIVKKDSQIYGVRKVSVGIDALIQQIKKSHDVTSIEIIQHIDEDIYLEEKQEFLEIFQEILAITLEDIVGKLICPNEFFMIGGGSNKFIRKYLQNINLLEGNLKIPGKIKYVTPKIEYIDNIESSRSNLNIYAMMESTLDFIKKENDTIENVLKNAIQDID